MNKKIIFSLLLIGIFLLSSCASKDDDCTKIITISQGYYVNNQYYRYDTKLEVPCDYAEPEDVAIIEAPILENFSYEVLYFTFIPDTGNNTSQLKFQIKLNNPNNFSVKGLPFLTIRSAGDLEFTRTYGNEASVACDEIAANSNCTLTFDKEYPIDPNLGSPSFIELVSVKYYLTN